MRDVPEDARQRLKRAEIEIFEHLDKEVEMSSEDDADIRETFRQLEQLYPGNNDVRLEISRLRTHLDGVDAIANGGFYDTEYF